MLKREKFQLFIQYGTDNSGGVHSEIEVLFLLEGAMDVQVEKKLSHLKAEDILIVNANKHHQLKVVESPVIMRLMIDYMTVCDTFQGQDIIFWCDSTGSENERYNQLRVLLRRLLKHYVQAEDYARSFGFQADCYAILNDLTANFLVKAADVRGTEDGDRYEERLYQINHYINSNYDQPISMKELSEKLFLSNGYLSRFFKKNYGMSFANYLTNVRVLHAADELLYTDVPVTHVAYDCGFTSAALFNKVFKKSYGMTPTEFRKQADSRDKNPVDEADQKQLEKKIEQKLIEIEMSEGEEKQENQGETTEGVFSAGESVEFQNYWGDTINFGHASNLLDSSVREHLMILQRALEFKYVRIWSIFSEEFHIKPGQEQYDFNQIDSVLDFVLDLGMNPFIELGMKPNTIHYEIGETLRKITENRFSIEEWEHLIQSFMRHLSTRYGQTALDNWRMELWFDEDLRKDPQEWEKYFEQFDVTYRAVKSCNEKIALGGYGIRMDSGGEQRIQFLTRWSKRECRPDFISIMYYAYERGELGEDRYARRTTDNDAFIHTLRKEKERLQLAGMSDLPVYICEWNLTPSVRNAVNDTTFKGAYIMKNIIDLYGEVQAMGYGAGSDRMYTSYDTQDMLFGGTGLITKEGILKPAAFALDFLNRLFSWYIGKDKNYLITTDRHNNYAIVCHNQQVLNYNYYLTPETAVEKESVWKYFENRKNLKLHILLKDMKEGTYRIKVYRISDRHGSVLDIWGEMGYDNELSRNDVKYFRRVCEPNLSIRKVETVQGNLIINEELRPNEIAMIRVRYIG